MATKIKIVKTGDFLQVTPDGVINIDTSRQLLIDIAKAEIDPVDYELLIDFRETKSDLTVLAVYHLAAELCQHAGTFRGKAALLVKPGVNFDRASFFETCSNNRGMCINAFTDYEAAMTWLLTMEDVQLAKQPTKEKT